MPVPYVLVARINPRDKEAERKIYPVVKTRGSVSTETICEAIERNCTATRGDVKAVMKGFVNMMMKHLANGASIKLEDIGYFRVGIQSKGAVNEEDYHPELIVDKYINYQPIGKLSEERANFEFTKANTPSKLADNEQEEEGGEDLTA